MLEKPEKPEKECEHDHGGTDAKEIKEILEAVSTTVPKLLNEITEALFSAEKSEAFGLAVAKFYKSMVDAGMNEERAFELTEKFMDTSSPGGMISKVLGESGGLGGINIGGHGHIDRPLAGAALGNFNFQ